jgi:F-box-like
MTLIILDNPSPLSQETKVKGIDPLNKFPNELVLKIFSYLNLSALCTACYVSKTWSCLICEHEVWKGVIYRELAFSTTQWAEYFGKEYVEKEDSQEEFLSLPSNIVEEYKKFQKAFPQKKAKKDLHLIRIPKTLNKELTLRNLIDLAEQHLSNEYMNYQNIPGDICTLFENHSIDQSYWLLIIKDVSPQIFMTDYSKQKKIIDNLVKNNLINYEIPKTLEAVTYFITQHRLYKKKKELFGIDLLKNSLAYCIRCQESILNYHIIVGSHTNKSSSTGFKIYIGKGNYSSSEIRTSAVKKFFSVQNHL